MKFLLFRVKNILIHPRAEWQAIKDEKATYRGLLFSYVSILAAIPPAAAVANRIIFHGKLVNKPFASSVAYLFLTNAAWYCMSIVNVVIVGAIITAVITNPSSRWNALQGLTIAAYSFTPLFIAGSAAVFPGTGWIVKIGILYGIYLLYLGIVNVGSTGKKQALWYTFASFLSAGVIVGVINLFEYFFESLFMTKILF